jgi:phospholipid/cholesterol/gamma-HCH transport system substrate-binding protein
MQLIFEKREKIVGAFMVIMVVLLLTVVVMIGRAKRWFETYVTYYTVFDEAYNLGEDARVKLYKADIGEVKDMRLEGDKVKLELAILKDHASRIRIDSVATVESPTFVGSEYVSIKPGTPEASPIPEEGIIPSLPKKSLADILAEFRVETTAKMIAESFQAISEILDHLRDPKGPLYKALDSTANSFANIEAVTREIRQGKGSLGKLVRSEELLQKVLTELDHVHGILKSLEGATTAAHEVTKDIEGAMAKAPEIMEGLRESVSVINRILANIEQGSHDVPTVTRTTREGIKEWRNNMTELDRVLQSAQKSFLFRGNLPPEPKGETIDTGLRR